MKKLTPRQYAELLCELTAESRRSEIPERLSAFVKLLVRERATQLLPRILKAFGTLWNERAGVLSVEVNSAGHIPASVQRALRNRLGVEELELNEVVDPTMIGGLRLRIGDRIVDGTAHNLLEHLRIELSSP